MTYQFSVRKVLTSRLRRVIVAVIVLALAGFVAWFVLGGGTWRGEVTVMEAELRSPRRLALIVASCQGDPEVSVLRETDRQVQVLVIASSAPFRGGPACQDLVAVELQEPLGDRVLIDLHSGQSVDVSKISP